MVKYARWIVHGQRGHIEGLRVGRPLKMSLFTPLLAFSELLRHFYAGMGCAFKRGNVSLTVAPFSASFSFGQAKENEEETKTSKVSKSDSS